LKNYLLELNGQPKKTFRLAGEKNDSSLLGLKYSEIRILISERKDNETFWREEQPQKQSCPMVVIDPGKISDDKDEQL
jgi:hypothetical protein